MAGNFTLFTNDQGAAAGPVDYVKDVFKDVSLPANSNLGLTSTASTNPLGDLFANDDAPRYSAKTLFIKDLVLVEDRSLWISNKPTYRIVWNESFPEAHGYLYGDYSITYEGTQPVYTFKAVGSGMGVTGVIRKVAWLVNGSTSGTATAQLALDGVNTTTIDFSNIAANSASALVPKFSAFVHSSTNETKDIHDYRVISLQVDTLKVIGAIVYFENSGANIDVFPGTTYVDKSKITTTIGATFPLPSFGSSLGGRALIYKTQNSGYAVGSTTVPTMLSIAQGSSGTNLVSVSTGHGSSFPVASGIVIAQGTSMYIGTVESISTDTLTVSPTLPFGVSNSIYKSWFSGSTYTINSSLMVLTNSIKFADYSGLSTSILDPHGKFCAFGLNVGVTTYNGVQAACFLGASGFLQVEGYFSAAEIEYVGTGIHNATYSINGLPSWSINSGQTGAIRRTVFTEAGPGWNRFVFAPGSSHGAVGFAQINLYERSKQIQGVTFGALAQFDTLNAFTGRSAINATLSALGIFRRVFADQLFLQGSWIRNQGTTHAGGVMYAGSSTNSVLKFQYYGKDFALIGTSGGGTLVLDGAGIPISFNTVTSVASEGFHSLQYTVGSGGTAIIQALDYGRSKSEIESLQNYDPNPAAKVDVEEVSASYVSTSSSSASTSAPVDYNVKIWDTHNAVETGSAWKFRAPKSGKYRFTASFFTGGAVTSRLYKNGVFKFQGTIGAANNIAKIDGIIELEAGEGGTGDYIDIRPDASATLANDALIAYFQIERIGD